MRQYANVVAIGSTSLIIVLCAIPVCPALTVFPLAALVMALAYEQGPVAKVMAGRPILWLGRISFSLYLTHFTVLTLLSWLTRSSEGDLIPHWAYMAGVLSVIISFAALIHYGAERPLARLGRKFSRTGVSQTYVTESSRSGESEVSAAARPN